MTDQPEPFDLRSLDLTADRLALLLQLFPEIRTEGGQLDFERLKLALGTAVDVGKERYGLHWPGKAACFRTIQTPSLATLRPAPAESVNFDTSENLIIEGDNLEVLKLLQKSYLGQVKLIYIDPPYNTGNDFIYPDNYTESLQTYLEYTGQMDAEGRKFGTNTETDGRFHSKWLNMMYPRLYLARNLLREDGVIFISIDDSEIARLILLANEIFGEENFLGSIVVNTTPNARDYGHIGKMHEYILLYARDSDKATTFELEDVDKSFKYQDVKGGFNIHPLYNSNEAFSSANRPNLYYPFYLNPNSIIENHFFELRLTNPGDLIEVFPPKSEKNRVQFVWRWGKEKAKENLNKEIVGYRTEDGEFRVVQKMRHTSKLIRSLQLETAFSTRRGTAEVEEIFKQKIFPFPKSLELITKLIQVGLNTNDLVVDFFAGSGTTAHAVLDLNAQDGGNRRFILVQLPEPTGRTDYPTIADITKERVRRVIQRLNAEAASQLDLDGTGQQDRGFRVFKLAESNFTTWDAKTPRDPETLAHQLELHVHHIRNGRSADDLLYELLLKDGGYPLTTPIEIQTLAGQSVYRVAGGAFIICLERALTMDVIRAIAEQKPVRVVCLDAGFAGNDQLKANAVQIFKTQGVTSFKTV